MRSGLANFVAQSITGTMYKGLNTLSKQGALGAVLGRIGSIPVTLIDYTLEMLKEPILMIERVIFIAVNLFGSLFSEKCSISEADLLLKLIIKTPYRMLEKTCLLIPTLVKNFFNRQINFTLMKHQIDCYFPILSYQNEKGISKQIL